MRISDWSSDVCSSDLAAPARWSASGWSVTGSSNRPARSGSCFVKGAPRRRGALFRARFVPANFPLDRSLPLRLSAPAIFAPAGASEGYAPMSVTTVPLPPVSKGGLWLLCIGVAAALAAAVGLHRAGSEDSGGGDEVGCAGGLGWQT